MYKDYFQFKGFNSDSYGIVLCEPIRISPAVPKVKKISILGRNGDLHEDEGTYENRTITAKCYLLSDTSANLEKKIDNINNWLLGDAGYHNFYEKGKDDAYFMARAVKGIERYARMGILNPFELEFDAMPQRFLESGENRIYVTSSITNPTAHPSRPILRIEASGAGYISFSGCEIRFSSAGTYIYDGEIDDAYFEHGGLSANEFLATRGVCQLQPGSNNFTMNNVISLYITPRWWKI